MPSWLADLGQRGTYNTLHRPPIFCPDPVGMEDNEGSLPLPITRVLQLLLQAARRDMTLAHMHTHTHTHRQTDIARHTSMTYHSQAAAFPAPLASSLAYPRQRAHWISFSIPKTIYRFLCRRGNLEWLNARKPSCGCHLILPQNRIFAAFLTSIFGAHTFTPSWVRSQNPRFATAAASCVCDCVWAGTEAQCRHLVSDTCSKRSVSSLDHPQRHWQTHTHTHVHACHIITSLQWPVCRHDVTVSVTWRNTTSIEVSSVQSAAVTSVKTLTQINRPLSQWCIFSDPDGQQTSRYSASSVDVVPRKSSPSSSSSSSSLSAVDCDWTASGASMLSNSR